jgi:carbamoyl-phosphate synthase large subunit
VKRPIRILFTAGGSPGMESLYHDLNDRYELYFADMDPQRISNSIPNDRKLKIPPALSGEFKSEMIRLCGSLDISLLVPGVDEELAEIRIISERLNPTKVFLPNLSFIETMNDKLLSGEALRKKGIDVPKSALGSGKFSDFEFPVIVKPRWGRGSRQIQVIEEQKMLDAFLSSINGHLSGWVVEEFFEGKEYTVQVFASPNNDQFEVYPILVHEKRGSTTVAEMRADPEIINYCSKLHNSFSPMGCYNVQLVKTLDGAIKCFEINPRVSTTLCLIVHAGVEPFGAFFAKNPTFPPASSLKQLKLIRHWVNEYTEVY